MPNAEAEPAPPAGHPAPTAKRTWKNWLVPIVLLLMAGGVVMLIAGNWDSWVSQRTEQETDDAYVHADLTPLSTKVAGLVADVKVGDYQHVKPGELLVELKDDDFRAQVEQATAGVAAGEDALVSNARQKELQDARIAQAEASVQSAEADITAAEAGIDAANSAIANARGGIDATKADVDRTASERRRQEALIATDSTTRQRLEQAVADEQRFHAMISSREADLASANAQLKSREADLARAKARLENARTEVTAQKRQRAVLDAQSPLLEADLKAKRATLSLADTNLGYTRIVTPEAGVVSERKVRPGQFVSPGTQVITLVQDDVWIEANYKETQVGNIRAGDPATIRVDALGGATFKGKVERVSPASGSQFALLPPDNATGNFTKVIQRIPVKIVLEAGQADLDRLRPGYSVIARVSTSRGGH